MPDPRWTGPPEVIAAIFETGSPDSVIANNLVWLTEITNYELSSALSAVNTAATAAQWQGVGSLASVFSAFGLNTGLQTLVAWITEKVSITQAAVDAFMMARSSVIPSLVSQTNRDEWSVLNATNFFGQNTPAIVERDTEYFGEHWPHNSSLGWAYSATLSALAAALAVPPPIVPLGASPAAPATAGEAVAQATAQTGMSDGLQAATGAGQTAGQAASSPAEATDQLSSLMQQPLQMVSGTTQPLTQLLQAPTKAFEGFSSLPQSMIQSLGGMFPAAMAQNAEAAEVVAGPLAAGGGAAGGVGAAAAGGAGGVGGFPGAALTCYTRPTSSFEPEVGGRPIGLRAGVLSAAEVRGPTALTGIGGAPMPMTPAGMLARGSGTESEKDAVTRARVIVDGDPNDPR